MRVTGGRYRGIPLQVPDRGVRPSSDRARESLFSILGALLPEARVLDLFAGTGALGIEALSRGAASATFVEQGGEALAVLQKNLAKVRAEEQAQCVRCDVPKFLRRPPPSAPFDLVFADPPYAWKDRPWLDRVCEGLAAPGWMNADGLLVFERDARDHSDVPSAWSLLRSETYGETALLLLEPAR